MWDGELNNELELAVKLQIQIPHCCMVFTVSQYIVIVKEAIIASLTQTAHPTFLTFFMVIFYSTHAYTQTLCMGVCVCVCVCVYVYVCTCSYIQVGTLT